MMEALCDSCGKVFTVVPAIRKDGEIETTFFTCARCGHEYIVCRTDSAVRGLGVQVDRQRQRNGERQRRGELTRRHVGRLRCKTNQFKAGLDALNKTE